MTMMERVATLRQQGLSNAIVAERLGLDKTLCRVMYYNFCHKEKLQKYRKEYYKKNRSKIDARVKRWRDNNPEAVKEYYFKNKCKAAGVEYA